MARLSATTIALDMRRPWYTRELAGGRQERVAVWRAIAIMTSTYWTSTPRRDLITEHMKPISDMLKKKQHLNTVKGRLWHLFETAHDVDRCLQYSRAGVGRPRFTPRLETRERRGWGDRPQRHRDHGGWSLPSDETWGD